MLSMTELAWLAGILEGEGCFLLTTKSKSNLGYPQIAVSMTDKDVMDRIALLLEASIYVKEDKRKEHYKDQWTARINGARAVSWMMTLYSFMGERRKAKIRQVLMEWRANPKPSQYKIDKTWNPDIGSYGSLDRALQILGVSEEKARELGLLTEGVS